MLKHSLVLDQLSDLRGSAAVCSSAGPSLLNHIQCTHTYRRTFLRCMFSLLICTSNTMHAACTCNSRRDKLQREPHKRPETSIEENTIDTIYETHVHMYTVQSCAWPPYMTGLMADSHTCFSVYHKCTHMYSVVTLWGGGRQGSIFYQSIYKHIGPKNSWPHWYYTHVFKTHRVLLQLHTCT